MVMKPSPWHRRTAPKIQLLLTDVIMPGLSGKMLAEWLSQVNPALKVLFISGYINNNAVRTPCRTRDVLSAKTF